MKCSFRMAVCALGMLWGLGVAQAQTMPQDNWRYDNLKFAGPDADAYKRSIAIGSGGVYVGQGNPATTIAQFQENGVFVRKFGAFGAIVGMACDSTGNLYVLDRTDSKVRVFSKDGAALREWGEPGSADGQFSVASWDLTTSVAVDTNNQIYVCDPGNSRVQVFNDQGVFLRSLGGLGTLPGQFAAEDPRAIAVGRNGWVYVMSYNQRPLQVLTAQGAFVKSHSSLGGSGIGIAVTADGLLAVCDDWWIGVTRLVDLSLADLPGRSLPLTGQGIAFNARGDYYRVTGNNVEVYEREYSSVQNSRLPPAIPQPMVLAVAQRAGTSWLDMDYSVTDADSPTVHAAALAFVNGGNTLNEAVPMSTFMEGTATNIGPNQPANTTRRITWNMAADWSADFAQIQVEVLAKDSRNLLGVHWIRVPADGGKPAIEISRNPVSDAELLSLWYWFVATRHPGVTLANGTVYGTTGLYAGKALAGGTTTWTPGRWFSYEQMGVRAITRDEITRAQAGSYGFASVDANSVVREVYAPKTAIVGWGDNAGGIQSVPPYAWGAVKLAAGPSHMLALMSNGTVVAWGDNGYNQAMVPMGLTGVTAIAASDQASLALKNDGTLVAWGSGAETNVPSDLTSALAFAVGEEHGLAARTDGTVVCWGSSYSGATNAPAGLSNVTAVAAGYYFSVALKNDGTVVAWGYDGHGEATVPAGLSNVAEISAGRNHVVARKTDGTVVVWGRPYEGQLDVPPGLTGVAQVSAGGHTSSFTLARKNDGSVVAWGDNGSGQRNIPVGLAPVSYVAAGGGHSFVIIPTP